MTITFQQAANLVHCELPAGLIADAEVPVLTGPQRQGDVGIFPRPRLGRAELAAQRPVPAAGIPVVRGENGGHTHHLHVDGAVTYAPVESRDGGVLLGVLAVPEGAVAYLIHDDEHGCNAIGAGTYTIHGKREQMDEVRRVAD